MRWYNCLRQFSTIILLIFNNLTLTIIIINCLFQTQIYHKYIVQQLHLSIIKVNI